MQVYNGLVFSLVTAQLLQRLPALRSEMTHCVVALAGAAHTHAAPPPAAAAAAPALA